MNASRLVTLIPDALDLPPEERAAFLDRECRLPTGEIDHALRREAESLLASAQDVLDGELRSPVAGLAGVVAEDERLTTHAPPETVGPWRVTGVLGEGGQGVVYRASRADGAFEREVALKLLRPGVDGVGRMAARLEEERRVLAHLEHEGIARLYDGGVADDTGSGQAPRPYLAMELVRGRPITEAARGRTVRERVALLAAVADAVAFAHARLVVHRDLKPSNVLVTDDPGSSPGQALRPKLLDFGVAKLLGDEADPTLTVPGWMTPAYAAPEQIQQGEITTATDVYALGVLAYEVLAGERPYRTSGLTPAEAERVITQETPPPPSAHGDRTLRGDLDTIVLKALAKEPSRRYAGAEAFAADLRRHLDGLPVEARPATVRYRVGRFVRRHRAGVIGTVAALAVVVGVAGVAFAQVSAERDRAEATNDFLIDILSAPDPSADGRDVRVADLLDRASADLDSSLVGQYSTRYSARLRLAQTYYNLGLFQESRREYEHALALAEAEHGPGSTDAAIAHSGLANALTLLGEFVTADSLAQRAIAVLERDGGQTEELARAYGNLAGVKASLREEEGWVDAARRSLRLHREVAPEEGSPDLASAMNNLGMALYQTGDKEAGTEQFERSIAMSRRIQDPEIIIPLANLGAAYSGLDRLDDAERVLREAVQSARELYGDEHQTTGFALDNLGVILLNQNRPNEAIPLFQESYNIQVAALGPDNPAVGYPLLNLGDAYVDAGRFDEGERRIREARVLFEAGFGTDHRAYERTTEALEALETKRRGI